MLWMARFLAQRVHLSQGRIALNRVLLAEPAKRQFDAEPSVPSVLTAMHGAPCGTC